MTPTDIWLAATADPATRAQLHRLLLYIAIQARDYQSIQLTRHQAQLLDMHMAYLTHALTGDPAANYCDIVPQPYTPPVIQHHSDGFHTFTFS